jgi:hypothetical protein
MKFFWTVEKSGTRKLRSGVSNTVVAVVSCAARAGALQHASQHRVIIIDARKHFFAAVVLTNGAVTRCAPIVNYMHGWSRQRVLDYARRRGWRTITLEEIPD